VTNFPVYILALMAVCVVGGFFLNRNMARTRLMAAGGGIKGGWHSQASYHGLFTAWMIGIAGVALFVGGLVFRPENAGAAFNGGWIMALLLVSVFVTFLCAKRIKADFRARTFVERLILGVLIALSVVAVMTTFGIVMSLVFESWRFFEQVPLTEFLFGLQWSPQTALRADQAGSSGAFGAVPIFAGTFLIMLVAMAVAGPIGLLVAIYLAEYAHPRTRKVVKPLIEILAGIPTVVYGFFALLTVGPTIRGFAETLGFSVPTQSAISAGVVMGIMIVPLISSLSDDVITAVPQSMRDGSLALGATKSETMKQVIFAGALPGIIGAFLLAISRAIGETMIVVMAAGRAANLTGNPFEAVTTVTVQIVALLTGDQEFDSAKTLAAFALGLVLFVITLLLNVIALTIVRRYREQYD
jgi:phosphate transport system permease protein